MFCGWIQCYTIAVFKTATWRFPRIVIITAFVCFLRSPAVSTFLPVLFGIFFNKYTYPKQVLRQVDEFLEGDPQRNFIIFRLRNGGVNKAFCEGYQNPNTKAEGMYV